MLDRRMHEERYADTGELQLMMERALTPATVENSRRFVAYTAIQLFYPELVESRIS